MHVARALSLAFALWLGPLAVVAPAPAVVAALCIAFVLQRRLGVRFVALCLAGGALFGWRAHVALDEHEGRAAQARQRVKMPERCAGEAHVVSSPALGRSGLRYLARAAILDCENGPLYGVTLRLVGGPPELGRGDRVRMVAQVSPVRAFRNTGLLDPRPSLARSHAVLGGGVLALDVVEPGNGLGHAVDAARAHARARITASFSPKAVPLARALVLGESDLDPEDDTAFKHSGLAHLLAVSGTHLVFAVLALVRAANFVLVRVEPFAARFDVARFSAAPAAVLALLYADYAGGSGSAWRAAWMLAVVLGVRAFGGRPSGPLALALSIGVGAVVDPFAAFDLSFALSVAATGGLLMIGRTFERRIRPLAAWLRPLLLAIGATVSAMLPCLPLLSLMGPNQTLAGIFANVLAGPVGEVVALPLCLLHALLEPWPRIEAGVGTVASGALLVVRALAHGSAGLEALAFELPAPTAWQLAAAALGIVVWLAVRRRWCFAVLGALGVAELFARFQGAPRDRLRLSFLDVGQGDGILADLPDGAAMLVDAGGIVGSTVDPGARVILPLLRERRRRRLDVVVLSHPHPDHFLGLRAVVSELAVGELWDTGQYGSRGPAPYRELIDIAERRGVPIRGPRELCGAPRRHGDATIEVLHPCPGVDSARSPNDNSFVIRLSFGVHTVLFTGDAEHEEEADIVARWRGGAVDLLKVGHHGSRTSSNTELLSVLKPRQAVISSGIGNRFGHPHDVALERLQAAGADTLRVDELGSVIWESDGQNVEVTSFVRR
jgi:competence protein ComEC